MTQRKTALAALLALLAAACTTPQPPPPQTPPPQQENLRPQPPRQPATIETKPMLAPSILIYDRTPAQIMGQIASVRKSKGMRQTVHDKHRAEFSMPLNKTQNATEVRFVYQLAAEGKAWRLSAQVFTITSPGTSREQVTENTRELLDKLEQELATYSKR